METTAKENTSASVFTEQEKQAFIAELFKAGAHMGHQKSRSHPKMNEYVFATKHNIKLFDLAKTIEKLEIAAQFLKSGIVSGGVVLIVGTKPQTRDLVADFAKKINQPSVTERWLGGTMTNFKTIQKRLDFFESLLKKRETGELEKYTKKERLDFDRQIEDFEKKFRGWTTLRAIPRMILLVDSKKHETVLREAKRMGIPVVAIIDTDSNPDGIDYPIPANDDSRSAIKAVLDLLALAIEKAAVPAAQPAQAVEK